jgi:hypothetical protein
MAFVTNQWLVASPAKSRPHDPVSVSIETDLCGDEWCKRNEVVAGFILKRTSGDYKEVHFCADEMDIVLPQLMHVANAALKQQLARQTLVGLSDSELVTFLSLFFATRRGERPA